MSTIPAYSSTDSRPWLQMGGCSRLVGWPLAVEVESAPLDSIDVLA